MSQELRRILVVEPYFGGSHKAFLAGLRRTIPADWVFITLPARKWKMRMQLSAPWFAEQLKGMENRFFDTVLCSTFVDVAVLRVLAQDLPYWNRNATFCTYFHENQFVYPTQIEDASSRQFSAINFTTALASDRVAFNSQFNRDSFFANSRRYVAKASDIHFTTLFESLEAKVAILPPGQDFGHFPSNTKKRKRKIPVLCWNHRWEHDKNPEEFFKVLDRLDRQGESFRLVVLGQSFHREPQIFSWAEKRFARHLLHFGYIRERSDYIAVLQECDIVVSTALHEFFGIAVLEAVRAGCVPLVPDRLAYPELYSEQYRYGDGQLAKKLKGMLRAHGEGRLRRCTVDTDKFSWPALQAPYRRWLFGK